MFRNPSLRIAALLFAASTSPTALMAQRVQPLVHELDNGLRLLLLQRPGNPNIAAGWVAKVGSVNERPGITGIAHLFEHMMFKGTHAIGSLDIEQDLRIIDQLDELKRKIQQHERQLIERQRRGEIADAKDPEARSAEHDRLIGEFEALLAQQHELLINNDFNRIYTGQGASGMNAGTTHDFTVYFITIPANKLELWFWMESDRLANPVFREFYTERDVVHEERRLRTDSTPTGRFQEEFESIFWKSSPYGWPVVGWPSDLEGITREEALAFFDLYYAPNNLTLALAGDFDPQVAIALAERYFARLQRSASEPQPPRTEELAQVAERRMIAYADTNPRVQVRYHSVADGHVDEPAIIVLAQILNGRTGRLFRSLVEQQTVATSASATHNGLRYAGFFELNAVAEQDHSPEEVEEALYQEIARLQHQPVDANELQKVKNQNAAGEFRRLQSNFALMIQLLIAEAYRGWEMINTDPQRLQQVTASDVQRIANRYFAPENRTVAIYNRKRDATPEDPRLAGLDEEQAQQVRQTLSRIEHGDAEELRLMLTRLREALGQAPDENRELLEMLIELASGQLQKIEGESR